MQMKRTKSPYPNFYQHWGGHLPFPPEDCPCSQYSFIDSTSGMRWLDIGICCGNKCHCYPCRRLKTYMADECQTELKRLDGIRREMRGVA